MTYWKEVECIWHHIDGKMGNKCVLQGIPLRQGFVKYSKLTIKTES